MARSTKPARKQKRKPFFHSTDICIVTPTKDRPEKVKNLLNSLICQEKKIGRIIIVGTGMLLDDVVRPYRKNLLIDYVHSETGGQILQRKIGLSRVPPNMPLVATIDDDIVFEKNAIREIMEFCNLQATDFGGIGFNITNMPANSYGSLRHLFKTSAQEPGRILSSGIATSICNITNNIKTEWLNGGATLWRRDILLKNIHTRNVNVQWAPFEDLMYSYSVGKIYPLYVCAKARVLHDDVIVTSLDFSANYFRGKMLGLWHCYFVESHKNLHFSAAIIAIVFSSVARFAKDVLSWKINHTGEPLGRLAGLFLAITSKICRRDLVQTIEKHGKSA